jgi:hypothetical protein
VQNQTPLQKHSPAFTQGEKCIKETCKLELVKEKPNAHSSPFFPSEKKVQSNCWETNRTIKSSNCKLYQARMVDSILLHNVENSCLSDSSSVHGHTNTHNTHERRSSLRETAFTFQTSSTQNPNLRLQDEKKKKEACHGQRQTKYAERLDT